MVPWTTGFGPEHSHSHATLSTTTPSKTRTTRRFTSRLRSYARDPWRKENEDREDDHDGKHHQYSTAHGAQRVHSPLRSRKRDQTERFGNDWQLVLPAVFPVRKKALGPNCRAHRGQTSLELLAIVIGQEYPWPQLRGAKL